MITEQGVIESISRNSAMVRVHRTSACESCTSRGSCHAGAGSEMLVEVTNELNAKIDDRVEISVPQNAILKLSLLVYFFPIVALIIGAYLGNEWAVSTQISTTLGSILGGALAMFVAFFILKRLDRVVRGKEQYRPRLIKILASEVAPSHDGSR